MAWTWCHSAVNRLALSFAACRTRSSARDRAARHCVRTLVCWPELPLASSLPSTTSAVAAWASSFCIAHGSFVRSLHEYYGTVRLPASVHHGRIRMVHRADLAAMEQVRCRASRVPHTMFPCMPGVCDPARSAHPSPYRGGPCCLPRVRSASAPEKSADFGAPYPACTFPCQPFTGLVTRASVGGEPFAVGDLHPSTLCRFVPAHPNARGEPRSEAEAQRTLEGVGSMSMILIEVPSAAYP